MDALPNPNSKYFLKELCSKLLKSMSNNAPFDENIFTWILYCLAVGDKHLVLRTAPRDVLTVQKIAKSILFTIFGMNTILMRVRPEFTPEELLAGLFASPPTVSTSPSTAVPSNSNIAPPPPSLDKPSERRPRQRQNSQLGSSMTAASAAVRSPSYTRGGSYNRISHLALDAHHPTKYRLSVAATITGTDDERGSIRALRPLSGRGYLPPENDMFAGHPTSQAQQVQLPHALVVSGLESASSSVQETLWDMLRTRMVVLEQEGEVGNIWNLPDGFILIYVCSLGDGSSRPALQSALLDRFAFNANILLQSPPSPDLDAPKSPILRRTALLSREYIEQLQHVIHSAPMSDHVSLYISNLLSSIRYHPQLDASLITSRCSRDINEFTKASFVLSGSSVELSEDISDDESSMPERRKILTPDDVKRVIKHVVSHRVQVREGVHSEVLGSLLCTAINKSRLDGEPRRPIKDVLNEAIAAV